MLLLGALRTTAFVSPLLWQSSDDDERPTVVLFSSHQTTFALVAQWDPRLWT